MTLDTYTDPESLYTARGDEVNPNRPLFTGDIFRNVTVPGIPGSGMAMIVAHPCSFRRSSGQLADRVLVATVRVISKQGRNAWTRGLFDRMPLPDLDGVGFWAAYLADVGQAPVADLLATERLACLSEIGINMLQQRFTFHLTRAEIPTHQFDQAFSHPLAEADFLEDWTRHVDPRPLDPIRCRRSLREPRPRRRPKPTARTTRPTATSPRPNRLPARSSPARRVSDTLTRCRWPSSPAGDVGQFA